MWWRGGEGGGGVREGGSALLTSNVSDLNLLCHGPTTSSPSDTSGSNW